MYLVLVCVIIVLSLLYVYLVKHFTHWTRRGIPQRSITSQLKAVFQSTFLLKPGAQLTLETYNEFANERLCGAYHLLSPVLYLRDPELIKQITVQDFDHFTDHKTFIPEGFEPLWEKNLFSLKGNKWRNMRTTLSPSFTSSKMKAMFILINECALQFVDHFSRNKSTQHIEMKDAFRRFVNDIIASTAFGIKCDSLKEHTNEFFLMGREATSTRGFRYIFKGLVMLLAPKLLKLLGIKVFRSQVRNFFKNLVQTNIEAREKNGVVRPDFLHLLMEAKGRKGEMVLTNDDLTAQALLFFFAGFNSVTTLLCFLMYELALNPGIQERLRKEVDATSLRGPLIYENLQDAKYMDMVVSETLRKWPTVIGIDRVCVKPYTIAPAGPSEAPVHLRPGDTVWLPILGVHRNPQFYTDPERFDPERFSSENKDNLNSYAYIAFGSGPRSCIGNRFALLEVKTILFHILSRFEIKVSEKSPVPLKLANAMFGIDSQNGFWFDFSPRKR